VYWIRNYREQVSVITTSQKKGASQNLPKENFHLQPQRALKMGKDHIPKTRPDNDFKLGKNPNAKDFNAPRISIRKKPKIKIKKNNKGFGQ